MGQHRHGDGDSDHREDEVAGLAADRVGREHREDDRGEAARPEPSDEEHDVDRLMRPDGRHGDGQHADQREREDGVDQRDPDVVGGERAEDALAEDEPDGEAQQLGRAVAEAEQLLLSPSALVGDRAAVAPDRSTEAHPADERRDEAVAPDAHDQHVGRDRHDHGSHRDQGRDRPAALAREQEEPPRDGSDRVAEPDAHDDLDESGTEGPIGQVVHARCGDGDAERHHRSDEAVVEAALHVDDLTEAERDPGVLDDGHPERGVRGRESGPDHGEEPDVLTGEERDGDHGAQQDRQRQPDPQQPRGIAPLGAEPAGGDGRGVDEEDQGERDLDQLPDAVRLEPASRAHGVRRDEARSREHDGRGDAPRLEPAREEHPHEQRRGEGQDRDHGSTWARARSWNSAESRAVTGPGSSACSSTRTTGWTSRVDEVMKTSSALRSTS